MFEIKLWFWEMINIYYHWWIFYFWHYIWIAKELKIKDNYCIIKIITEIIIMVMI